ncbi:hypothetical protein PFICI_04133 [Pestalotiopsis fici W106-1]|uniref:Cytochrome P450 monooxygenase n=1 Tax=Pestalotiopsis fici (strain W106-1 / CGMCC3.15140) TaxID=1229662 RepID=W3XJ67_PESFW|nr:uncharacterized protein PFICI_04133 [Pestalotiopsis fici W106-1]ETS86108.1 hypothetical protein PFICI_04133 [Pestalotiopsis fici W106-1]
MDAIYCAGAAALLTVLQGAWLRTQTGAHTSEQLDHRNIVHDSLVMFFILYLLTKIYRVFLYHRYFSPLRHLPTPEGNHFLFGQALNLIHAESPAALYVQWMKQFPDAPVIRFLTFANTEILLPNSPNAHKDIFQTHCYTFRKPDRWLRMTRDFIGEGIATLEGEEHRASRKMLTSSFSFSSIKRLEPVFISKAREVCSLIDHAIESSSDSGTGMIDCTDTFSKATLSIMGVTSFGIELDYLASNATATRTTATTPSDYSFHQAYTTIFGPDLTGKILMFGSMFFPTRWLPIKANREYKLAKRWLQTVLRELIQQRQSTIRDAFSKGIHKKDDFKDLLSFIIEESMPGGSAEGIPSTHITGHLLQFLGAGHDTSANCLSWSMYTLASHQDIQHELREEINRIIGKRPSPSFADLDSLHYLNNFVREALRLYPPATIIYRHAGGDVIVDGIHIPKDSSFEIVAAVTSLNPLIWGEDAETFNPDRWDNLTEEQSSPYAFATFSNGPRICIGRQFALYEIKTILVEIIRNFRVLRDVSPFTIENPGLTVRPRDMKVHLERLE